jgi:hypothetical protein
MDVGYVHIRAVRHKTVHHRKVTLASSLHERSVPKPSRLLVRKSIGRKEQFDALCVPLTGRFEQRRSPTGVAVIYSRFRLEESAHYLGVTVQGGQTQRMEVIRIPGVSRHVLEAKSDSCNVVHPHSVAETVRSEGAIR